MRIHYPWISGFVGVMLLAASSCGQSSGSGGKTVTPPVPAAKPAPVSDAPHLLHHADGSVLARWLVAGKVMERRFAKGKPVDLPEFQSLLGKQVTLTPHRPERDSWPLPEKLFVISDVEGEYTLMRRFLEANKVIDATGKWSFGKGHLVCVGDMVDRGDEVTETLWLMHRLAREAMVAGGHLHYVLGNHEVMVMGGDVRYVHPKYRSVSTLLGRSIPELVGADTEIGRWLRTRNTLVKVGRFLFVHAGISPPLLNDKRKMAQINSRVRSALGLPPGKITDQLTGAILWGQRGPLWYRGYFEEWKIHFGPRPTAADIDLILKQVQASTIVIGHTKVAQVTDLYGGQRVLAIDVPWTQPKDVRGLLIQGEKIDVVDVQGNAQTLPNRKK